MKQELEDFQKGSAGSKERIEKGLAALNLNIEEDEEEKKQAEINKRKKIMGGVLSALKEDESAEKEKKVKNFNENLAKLNEK